MPSARARVVAGLVVAGALVFVAGCGDDANELAEEQAQQQAIEEAAKEAARDARQAERIRQLEKQLADSDVDGPAPASDSAVEVEPASFTTYTANEAGWSAEIPSGGGWSDPTTTEEVPGSRWRTMINGPGEIFLLIDATPSEPPLYNGPAQRRTVSHPEYGPVTEVVFQAGDSRIADCQIGTCVDYLVNAGAGGYGVLAGGPGRSFEELQGLAMRVMQSIRQWDY